MRNAYIVSYDIADPKRLHKVHKAMVGYGRRIQYSVFRCELSAVNKVRMIAKLSDLINSKDDQVLIIDLGPAEGRSKSCIESIGKPFVAQEHSATIV